MASEARSELRADVHSIEPIPESDKDSTGPQQMWIWAGANIAPINWALGALGIVLKLGLWETIAVIVLGNLVGCAIFSAFTVMGHKTGVNQMVLSRSAFGRRGAYLPSALMFLMTLGWIGVNTYFPVKIAVAILVQFGIPDTWLTNFVVVTVVMVIQVLIGIYGFYAIRTFEKYTVPVTVVIMALMSVLAWTRPGVVNWGLTSPLPPAAHFAMLTLLMTAIGVGWGISWVTWASDYSRFVPRTVSSSSVFWYSYLGMFVPTVWLAILGLAVGATLGSAIASRTARLMTPAAGLGLHAFGHLGADHDAADRRGAAERLREPDESALAVVEQEGVARGGVRSTGRGRRHGTDLRGNTTGAARAGRCGPARSR